MITMTNRATLGYAKQAMVSISNEYKGDGILKAIYLITKCSPDPQRM